MTQTQDPRMTDPDTPVNPADISSRLSRIIGALRARREAVAAVEEAQAAETVEQPVEWALRLMM